MAITFALARATKYSLAYVLTQDGAAGNAASIGAAVLDADADQGGPMTELMRVRNAAGNVNSVAEAQELLQAFNAAAPVGPALPIRARSKLTPLSATGPITWLIQAGVDVDRASMVLSTQDAGGIVASALLEIDVQHSLEQ